MVVVEVSGAVMRAVSLEKLGHDNGSRGALGGAVTKICDAICTLKVFSRNRFSEFPSEMAETS